jgi:hypothetical protein
MASEYVVRLIDEVTNGPILTQSFFIPIEINEVKSCMGELQRLSKKLTGITKVIGISNFICYQFLSTSSSPSCKSALCSSFTGPEC